MILITLKDLSAGEARLLLRARQFMILIITRHRIRIRSLIVFPVALGLSLLGGGPAGDRGDPMRWSSTSMLPGELFLSLETCLSMT